MEKLPVSFFFSFYSGIWNLTTMHFWQYVEPVSVTKKDISDHIYQRIIMIPLLRIWLPEVIKNHHC